LLEPGDLAPVGASGGVWLVIREVGLVVWVRHVVEFWVIARGARVARRQALEPLPQVVPGPAAGLSMLGRARLIDALRR
jgi:hypothetical protein